MLVDDYLLFVILHFPLTERPSGISEHDINMHVKINKIIHRYRYH
jgi:hypothetical protein